MAKNLKIGWKYQKWKIINRTKNKSEQKCQISNWPSEKSLETKNNDIKVTKNTKYPKIKKLLQKTICWWKRFLANKND